MYSILFFSLPFSAVFRVTMKYNYVEQIRVHTKLKALKIIIEMKGDNNEC